MNIPQKSLFSLLSCYQKVLQLVEIWQSYDKKISLHSFFETRCTLDSETVRACNSFIWSGNRRGSSVNCGGARYFCPKLYV